MDKSYFWIVLLTVCGDFGQEAEGKNLYLSGFCVCASECQCFPLRDRFLLQDRTNAGRLGRIRGALFGMALELKTTRSLNHNARIGA